MQRRVQTAFVESPSPPKGYIFWNYFMTFSADLLQCFAESAFGAITLTSRKNARQKPRFFVLENLQKMSKKAVWSLFQKLTSSAENFG